MTENSDITETAEAPAVPETEAVADPSAIASSAVSSRLATPRTPSVPKSRRIFVWSSSGAAPHTLHEMPQDLQRVHKTPKAGVYAVRHARRTDGNDQRLLY